MPDTPPGIRIPADAWNALTRHPEHLFVLVACDGAHDRDSAGAGVVIQYAHETVLLSAPVAVPVSQAEAAAVRLAIEDLTRTGTTSARVYVDNDQSERMVAAAGHQPIRVKSDEPPPLHALAHYLAFLARERIPAETDAARGVIASILAAGPRAKERANEAVVGHLFPTRAADAAQPRRQEGS